MLPSEKDHWHYRQLCLINEDDCSYACVYCITHHKCGERYAGGDLQGVGGDGLADWDDHVAHQVACPAAQTSQQGST